MSIDALKANLRRRIGGYTVAIKNLSTSNLFYRGRKTDELPRTLGDISYPKAEFVTKLGRAIRVGRPVFYCSRGSFPAFFEIHANQGDHIALSEWMLTESVWMHHLGYHPEALNRTGAPTADLRVPLLNPIPNETVHNNRIRRRMSLAFTREVAEGEEWQYNETVAINELLFDRAELLPVSNAPDAPTIRRPVGTVYPAVRMNGLADNAAIWPEYVERCKRVKSVRYVRVEAADHGKLAYTFLTLAHSDALDGSTIVWRESLPSEQQRRTNVVFEDGRWVFRDGGGLIYDEH
jgi:hypothetical protein